MPNSRSQLISITAHVLAALLLLAISRSVQTPAPSNAAPRVTALILPPLRKKIAPHSGGSNQTSLPARHGSAPAAAHRTFIPPVSNLHPQIAIPVTVAFDVPRPIVSAAIGDPLSRLANGGLGINGANGIGNHGCCGGIGEGASGSPGLSIRRGAGVTPPELIYKVEPEFSEEARKAKYQGVVVLSIVVDAAGMVRRIHVLHGLGLGLDEQAIEAVSRWRFRPGAYDGQPAATEATVQVTFQLL